MDELLDWIRQNAPKNLEQLNEGASTEDIEQVERETGLVIPDDYKAFLKQHNGESGESWLAILGDGNQLLSCEAIVAQYQLEQEIGQQYHDPEMETIKAWRESAEEGIIFVTGPVKPLMLHPKWLPMTCMNGDVFRYFDYDPAPGGVAGQIIEVDPECCSYEVIAGSFSDLVAGYCADLESGVYAVDDEHDIQRVTEKQHEPGVPDWLTNAAV